MIFVVSFLVRDTCARISPDTDGAGFSYFTCSVKVNPMSRTLESTPQLRIVAALSEARKARHHRDCHCRMFQRQFCNAVDALFQAKLNRELEALSSKGPPCESHS